VACERVEPTYDPLTGFVSMTLQAWFIFLKKAVRLS